MYTCIIFKHRIDNIGNFVKYLYEKVFRRGRLNGEITWKV